MPVLVFNDQGNFPSAITSYFRKYCTLLKEGYALCIRESECYKATICVCVGGEIICYILTKKMFWLHFMFLLGPVMTLVNCSTLCYTSKQLIYSWKILPVKPPGYTVGQFYEDMVVMDLRSV